ncbi:MAG: ROK family protein, partial [Candidatus Acidiferrales bacterium]
MQKTKGVILAVDIGGTKVAAGLVTSTGEILATARTRMVANKSAAEGLAAVQEAIDSVLKSRRARKARAIGVSVPGWVDSRTGTVLDAANLSCWKNFHLAAEIKKHYGLPVRVANDAKAAALAEAAWGAGRDYRNVFYATLGTGLGTGLVIDGRIYSGRRGAAGEGGHTTIDFRGPLCGCGKRGCAETYISGPATARNARERIGSESGDGSLMLKLAGGDAANVTAETVAKAAAAGDKLAKEVLAEMAEHLAIWLGNITDLLEPGVIVIGGGLADLAMSLLPDIRRHLDRWACSPEHQQTPIVKAFYGAESALVGAGALWLSRGDMERVRREKIAAGQPLKNRYFAKERIMRIAKCIMGIGCLFLATSVCAQQQRQSSGTTRELTTMLNQFMRDASSNNAAGFDRFFADDVIYTGSNSMVHTKAGIMRSLNAPKPAAA